MKKLLILVVVVLVLVVLGWITFSGTDRSVGVGVNPEKAESDIRELGEAVTEGVKEAADAADDAVNNAD